MEAIMPKHVATWVEIDAEALAIDQRQAYDEYKAAYRDMKVLRTEFERSMGQALPEGKRMIFGYNFGKLSVALVEDDRKPAKPAKQSLAEFLASQAEAGRRA
jgi:hypothetical protein